VQKLSYKSVHWLKLFDTTSAESTSLSNMRLCQTKVLPQWYEPAVL